ncbi:MAG: hypothetical protein PHS46_07935 [Candidatus Omnitrophica bacterium]|nr:hypothetical protein [Candidatus Omnitrophota bacterium]
MSTYDYAKDELERAKYFDGGMNQVMAEDVLELIKVFGEQGHSGFTAPFCIRLFSRLASHKPIGPLTGEDDEWVWVADGVQQNKRLYSVFKEGGRAYRSDGKVFRDPNGTTWTNSKSRVDVTFPYEVCDPIIVDLDEAGNVI